MNLRLLFSGRLNDTVAVKHGDLPDPPTSVSWYTSTVRRL